MPDATVNKDVFPRYSGDEFGVVSVEKITQIIDEGHVSERVQRQVYTPDDSISNIQADLAIGATAANRLTAIINAARYPEAVARFNARKAAGGA